MAEVNPAVLEYIIQLQQRQPPRDQNYTYKMAFVLLGIEQSQINMFYKSIYQYINFGGEGKLPKMLELHGENKRKSKFDIRIYNMKEDFSLTFIQKTLPIAALLFYSEDSLESINFVRKICDSCYDCLLQEKQKIIPLESRLSTLDDFARQIETQEARPAIIVMGLKGSRKYKNEANALRKYVLERNYRIQDFDCYNSMSYQIIFSQAFSLAEIYPYQYFQACAEHFQKSKKRIWQ